MCECDCMCVWFHYSNCNSQLILSESEWRKEGVRVNGIVPITTATATSITLKKTNESNCRTISLYWYLSRFVLLRILIFWKMVVRSWIFSYFLCTSMYVCRHVCESVACIPDRKWEIKEEASERERAECEFHAIIISWCGFPFHPSLNLFPSPAFYKQIKTILCMSK